MHEVHTSRLGDMSHWIKDRIAYLRSHGKNKTQKELAQLLRVEPPRIVEIAKGGRRLQAHEAQVVIDYLELSRGEVQRYLGYDPDTGGGRGTINVVGYIGAGAVVHPYDDFAQGSGMDEAPIPPGASAEDLVGLRVRGDSMYPITDGSTVLYRRNTGGIDPDAIGKMSVVQTSDGRTYVKILRKTGASVFSLDSWNAEPITDATVVWAARVRFIIPA